MIAYYTREGLTFGMIFISVSQWVYFRKAHNRGEGAHILILRYIFDNFRIFLLLGSLFSKHYIVIAMPLDIIRRNNTSNQRSSRERIVMLLIVLIILLKIYWAELVTAKLWCRCSLCYAFGYYSDRIWSATSQQSQIIWSSSYWIELLLRTL